MKKVILSIFLMFGALTFSQARFVEECEITSKGTYNNGIGYINCISLQSGKHFNFKGVNNTTRQNLSIGSVYKIFFNGQGYKGLYLTGYDYLY